MSAADKNMKKITLSLQAGSAASNYSLTPSAVAFDFIYGAAPTGLTQLERTLGDMATGDSREISLSAADLEQFFGSLFVQVRHTLKMLVVPEMLYLHITLLSCLEVEPREIVQAMAKSLGHGNCGGSCGCGCG